MTAANITTIDATTTVTTTVVVSPPAEEAPPATKAEKESPEEREQRILTHQLLARQLEYYFSTGNLSRDTYLSTLRELNDSYVPVSIIANFGKVQALAPYESAFEAIVVAATEHSDLLEIVELDEDGKKIDASGARAEDTEQQTTTIILAVGSTTGSPIPVSQIQTPETKKHSKHNDASTSSAVAPERSAPAESAGSNVQNTIILREVAEDVEEQTLRDLFGFEGCPSIESIREDLHNCWFVTLDTTSKDEMFDVMMKLRTTKFPNGDSVKARVKSSASAATSPQIPNSVVYNPKISTMFAPQFQNGNGVANGNSNGNGGNSNSRKKRSANKGRNNNNSNGGANNKAKNNQQSGASTSRRRNGKDESSPSSRPSPSAANESAKTRTKKVTVQPPSMGETNFPSLPITSDGNSKPFQVEKVPTDDDMLESCEKERRAGFSDSSSTATTSTASTPTEAPPSGVVSGGYAAALLRPAAPTPPDVNKADHQDKPRQQAPSATKKSSENAKRTAKKTEGKLASEQNQVSTESSSLSSASEQPSVSVKPPVWGQGRSFADIVSA